MPPADAGPGGKYLALGDSFTAAPLTDQHGGSSAACLRSSQDYPALVAAALRPSFFVNVSCFGASTADMSQAQRATSPPQLNALSAGHGPGGCTGRPAVTAVWTAVS